MSWTKSLLLVLSGILLGICFTVGMAYGLVRGYITLPPQITGPVLNSILGSTPLNSGEEPPLNESVVRNIARDAVQQIISSPEAQALIGELVEKTPPETFANVLEQAIKSPSFRKALSDILLAFFKSQEGKDLLSGLLKGAP